MAKAPRRPRRFETPEELSEAWEAYKRKCDNQKVLTHHFVAKNSDYLSKKLRQAITYTIEGFCVDCHLPRQDFYQTYAVKEGFSDIAALMREECEVDARSKFELGITPPSLAPLWMSKYGYATKSDNNIVGGGVPVVIRDDMKDDD
ncbi:MAG: DNA-packaging protein [Oscillospiraceae bacterium]|nr:DNA-packaging protein [Oscillospiraceae bacterium]